MKKHWIGAALAVLLCAGSCLPALAQSAAAPKEIRTRAELEAMEPQGSYVLAADIDLSGGAWTPMDFHGTFDGGGHTLYNLKVRDCGGGSAVTVDGNHKEYDTRFAALFADAANADIHDLVLLNADVQVNTDDNCFAALLAAYTDKTRISGCSVSGRVTLTSRNWMCGVGGLTGYGFGLLQDSSADVTLVLVDENRDIKCEEFLGGLLACGYSDIEGCTAKVKGYASVHGYVHNGGMVGMHHIHAKSRLYKGYVKNCSVSADITFFEDNTDRRAYCKAVIGEQLNPYVAVAGNTVESFKSTEVKKFDEPLLPETCAQPQVTQTVTPPTCTAFGYTTYTCAGCGYSYTDDYTAPQHERGEGTVTPPTCTQAGYTTYTCKKCGVTEKTDEVPAAHTPGEWKTTQEATYDKAGEESRVCAVCGEVLESRALPQLVHAASCAVEPEAVSLSYRGTAQLTGVLKPDDVSEATPLWSSSDERVATVDGGGLVTAAGRGSAVITCASADGQAAAQCPVTVSYTWKQWLIKVLLFGWIWY